MPVTIGCLRIQDNLLAQNMNGGSKEVHTGSAGLLCEGIGMWLVGMKGECAVCVNILVVLCIDLVRSQTCPIGAHNTNRLRPVSPRSNPVATRDTVAVYGSESDLGLS